MSAEEGQSPPAEGGNGGSKMQLLLPLLNTVAILAVIGTLVYTRILFKRPSITEADERARIAQSTVTSLQQNAPTPGNMTFDPVTVNIESNPGHPRPADDERQIQGKMHYANIGFALELRDISTKDRLEPLRPLILDKVLAIVGRKSFQELTTVQGRYVVKTEILDATNEIAIRELKSRDVPVMNVYFNRFIVQ
jgi:flagellar basal body-associated protein FliL